MWLDSEVGVGSTFGFAVPSAPATFPVRTSVGRSTGRPAIVVVEDDPPSLDLLMLYLDGLDMDIVGYHDAEEGLAVIRELLPRAVILDLRLPGMDGWELLRTIRGDPGLADVPVIVVSVVDDRPRGLALGAAVYLVKPVTRDEILTALETVHAYRSRNASSAKPRTGREPVNATRVLVVEDNERNLKLVRDVLQYAGYEIIEASTGEEGVELAQSRSPGLILMDLQLPDIDGMEALRRIRKRSRCGRCPGGRCDGVRDAGRPRPRLRSRVSTATWRNHSACESLPTQVQQFLTARRSPRGRDQGNRSRGRRPTAKRSTARSGAESARLPHDRRRLW